MPVSVTMPALGESVTEGTVTRWLKQEGEQVQADEPLLEVSTDKVDTEIPSPASGVLTSIKVNEDETVDVGTELAVIGDADAGDAGGSDEAATAEQAESTAQSESTEQSESTAQPDGADSDDDADDDDADRAEQAVEDAASAEPADQPTEPEPDPEPKSGSGSGSGSPQRSGGTAVTMPALGESVTEGTVTRWLKQVGDEVAVDEALLEVSTDKVDTEIPSPVAGTVLEISVNEDETVEVGATLATIGSANDAPADDAPAEAAPAEAAEAEPAEAEPVAADEQPTPQDAPAAAAATAPEHAPASRAQQPADGEQPAARDAATAGDAESSAAYVTPLVRKLATQHGVDLATLRGTGVGGRIRKQDVLEAAQPPTPEPAAEPATTQQPATGQPAPAVAAAAVDPAAQALRGKTEKMSRLRSLIARRMVESLQVSAQLTTVVEVDITEIARLRTRVKGDFEAREGVKLSFLPFFALATVEALRLHPKVNSSVDVDAGTVTYHDSENLGVAVDTERGLLVPVIHDAGDLNLGGIARKIADLADRTRRNKITPDELSGGTFTLTNTGSRGALFDTPIINQPQSGILGTGTVVRRPVVIDHPDLGEIVTVRSMVYLALSYDHRIVDGADAARFLTSMKQRLEGGDFDAALGLR